MSDIADEYDGRDGEKDDGPQTLWDLAERLAAVGVTGAWMAALFLGFEYWLVILLVGYIVVVPAVSEIGDYVEREKTEQSDEEPVDPVERLRERYVEGEMSEAEFERRLEELLGDGETTEQRREREYERA